MTEEFEREFSSIDSYMNTIENTVDKCNFILKNIDVYINGRIPEERLTNDVQPVKECLLLRMDDLLLHVTALCSKLDTVAHSLGVED